MAAIYLLALGKRKSVVVMMHKVMDSIFNYMHTYRRSERSIASLQTRVMQFAYNFIKINMKDEILIATLVHPREQRG